MGPKSRTLPGTRPLVISLARPRSTKRGGIYTRELLFTKLTSFPRMIGRALPLPSRHLDHLSSSPAPKPNFQHDRCERSHDIALKNTMSAAIKPVK